MLCVGGWSVAVKVIMRIILLCNEANFCLSMYGKIQWQIAVVHALVLTRYCDEHPTLWGQDHSVLFWGDTVT